MEAREGKSTKNKASLNIPRNKEVYVVSSGSSEASDSPNDRPEPKQRNETTKPQNMHSLLLEETRIRLQNFAADVEQYHDGIPEVESPVDDSEEKIPPRKSLLSHVRPQIATPPSKIQHIEKNSSAQKTLNKYVDKKHKKNKSVQSDTSESAPKSPDPQINLTREENAKILVKIYEFYKGKYSKIQILVALHKHAGRIYEAMIALSRNEVDDDPRLLVDTTCVSGSSEDKKKYFVN